MAEQTVLDRAGTLAATPDPALALDLAEAAAASAAGLLFIDASSSRLEILARLAAAFRPTLPVLMLPPWDSSPYDRTPPSPAVMGQRVHALATLAGHEGPILVITSARAMLQLVPAPAYWADAAFELAPGDTIDEVALREKLAGFGYHVAEHVDQPGDVALRGHVIDIFPGNATAPVRLAIDAGRVMALHTFDAATQRSIGELDALLLRPVMESPPAPEQAAAEAEHMADPDGTVAAKPAPFDPGPLQATVLDYLPGITVALHPGAAEHWHDAEEQLAEAYDAARVLGRARGTVPPRPAQLTTPAATLHTRLGLLEQLQVTERPEPGIPPARDVAALLPLLEDADAGATVIAVADPASVLKALKRRGVRQARIAATWEDAQQPGISLLPLALDAGFVRPGLRVIPGPASARVEWTSCIVVEEPPRLTDIVVHEQHGVCRLSHLSDVEAEERLALAFHEGTELLVPMSDLSQVWRYGTEAGHIGLDRLHTDSWQARRRGIEAEIAGTAQQLADAAARRRATKAPVIEPAADRFGRVIDRFAYPPSPDQQATFDAVLADMRAGRPMDRLVCGDVGFGKTEVAIRAAAAAALAGYQVAIVAPTTILARQHLTTFRARLAKTGIRIEPLLRGTTGKAAIPVLAGLADGSIHIVIGTQAIAAPKLRFARLGLVVIDEEQRFGDADKRKLASLRGRDGAVHTMVMTATPIPRTLQSALVGLRDVSVIATPPVRRQPTRTVVLPMDDAILREALMREHDRGGQSFVVAPRIEDLTPLAARLAACAPELSVATAHGKLKPEALEDAVSAFTSGENDVLLATNIIEAGLDIPRANTILITGPHKFGLAQLHQMRGRVGRGARRGIAYVLTDPKTKLAAPTIRRLHTLETLEGLGAGVQLAVADMDTRGAGDLFGDAQAGHVHAIGTELYQHILARELARIEGQPSPVPAPDLRTEATGRIDEDLVPEANLRLELYRRLARLGTMDAADDFHDEMTDRFGPLPPAFDTLLDLARLRIWCRAASIARVDAGPQAVALTPREDAVENPLPEMPLKNGRIILPIAIDDACARLKRVLAVLHREE